MKIFTKKEKQSALAARKVRPYVHHSRGCLLQAQETEIRRILSSTGAQAKLTIGKPNDNYEQEADRVADQVMAMPDSKLPRQLDNEEEKETSQTKPLAGQITPLVQGQEETPEKVEEEPAQVEPTAEKISEMTSEINSGIQSLKGGGRPMSGSERGFFEPRFGADFSGVRVHNDERAAMAAKSIGARAFTHGSNVVFGAGEYSLDRWSGKKLLAHELTHVVQQNHDQQCNLSSSVINRKEPSTVGSDAAGKTQETITGERFIKGATDKLDVDPNDVKQGSLGDCWLLAGLQAVAAANPQAIRNMIKPLKGGKYEVTFYFPGALYGFNKETVIVDAKVPVSSKGGSPVFAKTGDKEGAKRELWVLLIEKAYAKTQGSYLKIEGDKHPQKHKVLEMITGKGQQEIYPNKMKANDVLARFAAALKANKGVTLASIKDGHAKAPLAGAHNPKIITNHGYSLIKVDTKARTVDLRNPWGDKYNALGLSIDDVVRFFRRARIGG